MTVQEHPFPRVELLINAFGDWLKHRSELKEMREMDAANFGRIASELPSPFFDQCRPFGSVVFCLGQCRRTGYNAV